MNNIHFRTSLHLASSDNISSHFNCIPFEIIFLINHTALMFRDLIIELPPPISLDQPVTCDKVLLPPVADLNTLQGKQNKACLVSLQIKKSLCEEHSSFHSLCIKSEIGNDSLLWPWKIALGVVWV